MEKGIKLLKLPSSTTCVAIMALASNDQKKRDHQSCMNSGDNNKWFWTLFQERASCNKLKCEGEEVKYQESAQFNTADSSFPSLAVIYKIANKKQAQSAR